MDENIPNIVPKDENDVLKSEENDGDIDNLSLKNEVDNDATTEEVVPKQIVKVADVKVEDEPDNGTLSGGECSSTLTVSTHKACKTDDHSSNIVTTVEEEIIKNVEIKQEIKRPRDDAEWSSDDEEFAGFEDCNGEKFSRRKKVKEEPLSDDDSRGYDDDLALEIKVENANVKAEKENTEESKEHQSQKKVELSSLISRPQAKSSTPKISTAPPASSSVIPPTITRTKPTPIKPSEKTKHNLRKPFEFGWKREIVYRAQHPDDKRAPDRSTKAEVYYITPQGKKLRSKNEIQQHLKDGLDITMFSLSREAIGMDPSIEIIRSAKPTSAARRANFLDLGEPDPSFGFGKRIPKPKMPKGASPPPPSVAQSSSTQLLLQKSKTMSTPINKRADVDSENKLSAKSTKTIKAKTNSTTPLTTGEDVSPPFKKRLLTRTASKPQTPPSHSPSHSNLHGASAASPKHIGSTVNASIGRDKSTSSSVVIVSPSIHKLFATNFFNNVSLGYGVLLHTFQYLKVQELLRASCVCRMWNQAANHHSLWKTVRMKNSQVNDWSGLVNTLKSNGTQHLDLRKMLIMPSHSDTTWQNFSENIGNVTQLECIDLCRCSSTIVEQLAESNPRLKIINAISIKDEHLRISGFHRLQELSELRLKSLHTMNIDSLSSLRALKHLKHLSLTSIKDLGTKNIEVLGHLSKLETLELGECSEFSKDFGLDVLSNLNYLERLRLEKGQENSLFSTLDTVAQLPKLVQLELVNFDIKTGFDVHLKQCTNLKRLLLIPTYISQSATTNHMILKGVFDLADYLEQLTWVVTLELMRVTELYVDQYNYKRKELKQPEDKIPVLKPIPGMSEEEIKSRNAQQKPISDAPQVEIIPLTSIENILATKMPKTKCSILKVPFLATWRQNIQAEAQ